MLVCLSVCLCVRERESSTISRPQIFWTSNSKTLRWLYLQSLKYSCSCTRRCSKGLVIIYIRKLVMFLIVVVVILFSSSSLSSSLTLLEYSVIAQRKKQKWDVDKRKQLLYSVLYNFRQQNDPDYSSVYVFMKVLFSSHFKH